MSNSFNINNNGPTQQQFGDHNSQVQNIGQQVDLSEFFKLLKDEVVANVSVEDQPTALAQVEQLETLSTSEKTEEQESLFKTIWEKVKPYSKLIGRVALKAGEASLKTLSTNWVVAGALAAAGEIDKGL